MESRVKRLICAALGHKAPVRAAGIGDGYISARCPRCGEWLEIETEHAVAVSKWDEKFFSDYVRGGFGVFR